MNIIDSIVNSLKDILYIAPVVLISLTVHEFTHALTAYKLGDYTAKAEGRLTLNPLKHIDPIGAIFFIIFHFGWAKPVPIRTLYFKNPKRDMAIVAIMGPVSNFIMALIAVPLLAFSAAFFSQIPQTETFFSYFIQLNIALGIFNLIPFPPLDGSRLLMYFLPPRIYMQVAQFEQYSFIILIGVVYLGAFDALLKFVITPVYGVFIDLAVMIYKVLP